MTTGAVLSTLAIVLLGLLVVRLVAVVRNDGYGQRPPPPRLGAHRGPR